MLAPHRTAQRMTRALERAFPHVEVREDEERRRRWRLRSQRLGALAPISPAELSALTVAAGGTRTAGRCGKGAHPARAPRSASRAHARGGGAFQREEEYGEVVWRFAPRAAEHARGFEFHPEQVMEDQPDGSLVVRFHAAGWLEMCWHLYQWGDAVEVLEPAGLRNLTENYRRSDFDALP